MQNFILFRKITADDLGIDPYELADVKISQLPNENFSPQRRSQIIGATEEGNKTEIEGPKFVGAGEKLGSNFSETVSANENAQIDPSVVNTRVQIVLPNGSRKVISISVRSKIAELYASVRKE